VAMLYEHILAAGLIKEISSCIFHWKFKFSWSFIAWLNVHGTAPLSAIAPNFTHSLMLLYLQKPHSVVWLPHC